MSEECAYTRGCACVCVYVRTAHMPDRLGVCVCVSPKTSSPALTPVKWLELARSFHWTKESSLTWHHARAAPGNPRSSDGGGDNGGHASDQEEEDDDYAPEGSFLMFVSAEREVWSKEGAEEDFTAALISAIPTIESVEVWVTSSCYLPLLDIKREELEVPCTALYADSSDNEHLAPFVDLFANTGFMLLSGAVRQPVLGLARSLCAERVVKIEAALEKRGVSSDTSVKYREVSWRGKNR
jgi:hypothetical protein